MQVVYAVTLCFKRLQLLNIRARARNSLWVCIMWDLRHPVVLMQSQVFWDKKPCRLGDCHRRCVLEEARYRAIIPDG